MDAQQDDTKGRRELPHKRRTKGVSALIKSEATKRIVLPRNVGGLLEALRDAGFESYIVGGCVRDALMGIVPSDYDVATSATPDEVKRVFSKRRVLETGVKHGTVTVLLKDKAVEITTFRADSTYSDNRHPDSVRFTKSAREDAARRDFTMNSLMYGEQGGLLDFFGGEDDIKNKTIRAVGDPDERFREDALRMLRALRFSACLGFAIEEHTRDAIFNNMQLLKNVSAERTACETVKMLCGQNAGSVTQEYIDVLGVAVPELLALKGFRQRNPHHIYDVLGHTARVVDNVLPTKELRLAALLHDIGKPLCFSVDETGAGHFYGHAKKSAELANAILRRLKLDNDTRELVVKLVAAHNDKFEADERVVKRALARFTPEVFFLLLELIRADNLAHSPEYFERVDKHDELEKLARDIIEQGKCFSLKSLAVNGDDLTALGVPSGKALGELLWELLEGVTQDKLPNERKELLEYAKKAYEARQSKSGEE